MNFDCDKIVGTGRSITEVFAHGVRKTWVQFPAPRLKESPRSGRKVDSGWVGSARALQSPGYILGQAAG